MWTWFLPAIQQAKKWIDEGRIGEIKAIQSDFGALMPFDPSGRLYNANLAGGALLDLGVYPVAISTFITGKEPLNIYSSGQIGTTGVDETTSIILDYGEIKASLVTSMVAQMQNEAIIFGNKGYIEIPDFYKAYSATLYNSERKEIETFSDNRSTWGYNYETQAVTNDLLEGIKENEIVSLEKTAIVQQILTTVKKQIGLVHPGD
jgi:predicted dehydrogenase